MTAQKIVGLAVRLFAIWLFLAALQMVGDGIGFNNQAGQEPTRAFFVLAALIFLLASAGVLCFKAHAISTFFTVERVPVKEA